MRSIQPHLKRAECNVKSKYLLFLYISDPYYWAWLPYASHPFSEYTKQSLLHKLKDLDLVQDLVNELYDLFKVSLDFKSLVAFYFTELTPKNGEFIKKVYNYET